MSRKLALLAAAVAFCGLASVAQAQGSGGTDQSAQLTAPTAGAGASMRARPMRAQRPMMRHHNRAAMRHSGRTGMAARGTDMGARTPNANAAYMGGGAVYERAADGSLRPVM